MAGYRHHYLPRFLQKGFKTRKTSKNVYTFVVKKETYFESSLMGIGMEKYFYSKEKESELDDAITEEEQSYQLFINSLREQDNNIKLDDNKCKRFIVHMLIRNKYIRKSFEEAANVIVKSTKEELSDPEKMKEFLIFRIKKNPEILREIIREELIRLNPKGFSHKIIEEKIESLLTENLAKLLNNIDSKETFELYMSGIGPTSKAGHIKGLELSLSPKKHQERLSSLVWSLEVLDKKTYILGDVGPLFQFCPNLEFKNYLFSNEDINAVYLPISDRHMIIGRRKGNDILDSKRINNETIMLSQEYIITSNKDIDINYVQKNLAIKSSCVPDSFDINEYLSES